MKEKFKRGIQILLLILGISLSFSLLKSISKITGASQKIVDQNKKVEDLKKENKTLSEELQNVQSVQFIEQVAHDKLGLAKKGEIVVVLPDPESLKALAPKIEEDKYELPDPNWKLWLKLFL